MSVNGIHLNGIYLNGIYLNGIYLNGVRINGLSASAGTNGFLAGLGTRPITASGTVVTPAHKSERETEK
jgi:hypothetical protein